MCHHVVTSHERCSRLCIVLFYTLCSPSSSSAPSVLCLTEDWVNAPGLHSLHRFLDPQSQLYMLFKLPTIWRIRGQPSYGRAHTPGFPGRPFLRRFHTVTVVGILHGDAASSSELHVLALGSPSHCYAILVTW